jgi:hypothetical protein
VRTTCVCVCVCVCLRVGVGVTATDADYGMCFQVVWEGVFVSGLHVHDVYARLLS